MTIYDISYFNISIDNIGISQEYVQSFNTNVPWGINTTYIYKDIEDALAPEFNRVNKHLVIENKIESGNIILKTQESGRTIIQNKLDVKEVRFNSPYLKPVINNVGETLIVNGHLTVSGGSMTNSNISGGSIINATINTPTANIRDLSVSNIYVLNNIEPLSNNTSNFGSSSKAWSKIFVYDLSVSRINGEVYGVSGIGLTANSVNSSHIIDGSILGSDISNNTITASNIADGTITQYKLTTAFLNRIYNLEYPGFYGSLRIQNSNTSGVGSSITFTLNSQTLAGAIQLLGSTTLTVNQYIDVSLLIQDRLLNKDTTLNIVYSTTSTSITSTLSTGVSVTTPIVSPNIYFSVLPAFIHNGTIQLGIVLPAPANTGWYGTFTIANSNNYYGTKDIDITVEADTNGTIVLLNALTTITVSNFIEITVAPENRLASPSTLIKVTYAVYGGGIFANYFTGLTLDQDTATQATYYLTVDSGFIDGGAMVWELVTYTF